MFKFGQYLAYDKTIHCMVSVMGIEGEVRKGRGEEEERLFGRVSSAMGDISLRGGVLSAAYNI